MRALCKLLFFTVLFTASQVTKAAEVHVAVASNFTAPMKEMSTLFEQETGHKAVLSFGSSGKFLAQINHGAPFDVFLSADQEKPSILAAAQGIVANSQFTYAIGTLVLWSADASLVIEGPEALSNIPFNKLALANPRLAPYGKAALQTLEALDRKELTESRWVQGENISQTYHFVASGNAQIGFVALSQVAENGDIQTGSGWVVPSSYYSPIKQDAVILKHAANNEAAHALIRFLKSPAAHQVIHAYGYSIE
ncbi:MAG TPA: molybdate ABC transporter substrate-binding protein [Aliidiomarina sp.]|nr:molybdate ABC transporter substrate-binding protein [Aliidiomarina sp.]